MKNAFILFCFLFVYCCRALAQPLPQPFKLPMTHARSVTPTIFHDGSSEVAIDGTLFSFDPEGNPVGKPVQYWDSVASCPNLSLTDRRQDIRYTLDPLLKGPPGHAHKRHYANSIYVEKLGSKGQFFQRIPFGLPAGMELPGKPLSEATDGYFRKNGDPVFLRCYTYLANHRYHSRTYQYVLHLADNSVEVTERLVDRIPLDEKKKSSQAWITPVGRMNDSWVVAVCSTKDHTIQQANYPIHLRIDFWTLNDSGTEQMFHTQTITIPYARQRYKTAAMPVSGQRTDSSLYFQYTSVTYFDEIANGEAYSLGSVKAVFMDINDSLEVKTRTLDVPKADFKMFGLRRKSVPQFCLYQQGGRDAFYFDLSEVTILRTRELEIFRIADDGKIAVTFVGDMPLVNDVMESGEVVFNTAFGQRVTDAYLVPFIRNPHLSATRMTQKNGTFRVDDNNIAHVLTVEYLYNPTKSSRHNVSHMWCRPIAVPLQ